MLSTGSTPWYLSAAVCPHAAPQQRAYGRSRSGTPVEPKAPCSSMPAPSRSRRQDLGESILPFCYLRKILHEGPAARIAADHSCCTPPSRCTSAEKRKGERPMPHQTRSAVARAHQAGGAGSRASADECVRCQCGLGCVACVVWHARRVY